MGRFSAPEIIILVVVLLLVFGAAKLPAIASSLGKSMKIFKKEVSELREDGKDDQKAVEAGEKLPTDDEPGTHNRP